MTGKQIIAKGLGAAVVGAIAGYILKAAFGQAMATSVVGGFVVLLAHEWLDAPVSTAIYEQLRPL